MRSSRIAFVVIAAGLCLGIVGRAGPVAAPAVKAPSLAGTWDFTDPEGKSHYIVVDAQGNVTASDWGATPGRIVVSPRGGVVGKWSWTEPGDPGYSGDAAAITIVGHFDTDTEFTAVFFATFTDLITGNVTTEHGKMTFAKE